jgi:hypothetical protein
LHLSSKSGERNSLPEVGNFFTTSRPNEVSVGREQNQSEFEGGSVNLLKLKLLKAGNLISAF